MPQIIADRVKETTTTTGTGTITLAGPATQFQSFAAAIGNGNTCDYCLLSGNGTDWEVGNGTVTTGASNTLSRTVIYASSNAGAAINLSGTSTVFVTASARRLQHGGLYQGLITSPPPTQAGTGLTTWINQSTATAADTAAGIAITSQTAAGGVLNALSKAAPATPYSFTALALYAGTGANYNNVALGWYDGTKAVTVNLIPGSGMWVMAWASATSYTTSLANLGGPAPYHMWLKIKNDGTNLSFLYSMDGVNFLTLYSATVASAPGGLANYNTVFFGVSPWTTAPALATLAAWAQGTS